MADVIRKATNRFTKGLIMDFSPENTKNEVLTHALNATLLTFNGNELSLQNDMGNGRVETAYLPEGYMPVGTCEYGGIIYIVSYNPLEDKSLIGCFPSPERNISSTELGISDISIDKEFFQKFENGIPDKSGKILQNTQYVLLKNDNLNPGDKFLVCANKEIYNEKLADLLIKTDSNTEYEYIHNPVIALNVVSIEESGKIVYLNSDIRLYEITNNYTIDNLEHTDTYKYHILGLMSENNGVYNLATVDPDNYRNVLSSGYSVFKSKTSGKLAILAELIMIDSYSVSHSIIPKKDEVGDVVEGAFDIVIHTDVSPEINKANYNLVPKLRYYYLLDSQGYIQIAPDNYGSTRELFTTDEEDNIIYNPDFSGTLLSEIYTPISEDLKPKDGINPLNKALGNVGKFNFPRKDTYHGRMSLFDGAWSESSNITYYTKFTEGKYHRIKHYQIEKDLNYYWNTLLAKFYYYNKEGVVNQEFKGEEIDEELTYYTRKPDHIYNDAQRDTAYNDGNYILYRLDSEPITATESEIHDETIEKFKYQEVQIFKVATEADQLSGKKLYYKEADSNTFTELIGSPVVGETYYVLKVEVNLVSIGYEVEQDVVKGTIYYFPGTEEYREATAEEIETYYDFVQFPKEDTEPYGAPYTLYWREEQWVYVEATLHEIENRVELNILLFYSTNYVSLTTFNALKVFPESPNSGNQLFIVVPIDIYLDESKFKPDPLVNYINGLDKPEGDYPKDDPLFVYTLTDFIPKDTPKNDDLLISEKKEYFTYKDLKLANITLPSIVSSNGLDLPFKYDYTLVPCMNYGKLQHLAVSNTIDFSKLHAFNQSGFHTWRYRIDNNQLRLTFGTDVYDTYENHKVDAIILEFYDLWGFAGSLEIVDKKSYSGIFTKVIPLNSFKALSRKKISGNTLVETFRRNINMTESRELEGVGGPYTYNGPNSGWSIPEKHPKTQEELNDCGTLYSNILYGVKAYFRRPTDSGGVEFIKKKDFFLYTLPIYNEYYYTLLDFSYLHYPEFEFVLTYKLKDNSTKTAYNQGDIVNGLNAIDTANVASYLGGFYNNKSELDIIKYYKYSGYTDLFLEIGLKQDYEDLNVSYDPNINLCFTCELLLVSDDKADSPFTISSGIDGLTGVNLVLNYNNIIPENVNQLGILTDTNKYASTCKVKDIRGANFITTEGTNPIKINYEFIVGYTANINDIRSTQVLATTVCALFHKKPSGEYNYEDFGVYESSTLDSDGNPMLFSDIMFYNEGTMEKEVFGICRQVELSGTMTVQCLDITSIETEALEIKSQGKLNTGDPLRLLVGHIGKLAFCQPHAHGLSELNGVNIHEGTGTHVYGIPPNEGGWGLGNSKNDDTNGIAPRDFMWRYPKYNMCLNTKNSINYHSEFLSTVDWKIKENGEVYAVNLDDGDNAKNGKWQTVNYMREFVGFDGNLLATFNKKMIKTMESVYAYNPEYDSLPVNVGDITLQNYNPKFSSNLLSINSAINFTSETTLNDFIYLGPILFSTYLKQLKEFSTSTDGKYISVSETVNGVTKPLPLILLIPNLDYCGTQENKYLISSLTYNTPVPKEIEQELEFNSSNITVVKHSNGDNTFINGSPNKKVLYAYNKDLGKMIQLDVSNYKIESSGELKLLTDSIKEKVTGSLTVDSEVNKHLYLGVHSFTHSFKNADGEDVTLNLSLTLDKLGLVSVKENTNSFFMGIEYMNKQEGCTFIMHPYMHVTNASNSSNYTYSVKLESIELQVDAIALNDKISLYGGDIIASQLTIESLSHLTSGSIGNVTLINKYNQNVTESAKTYWANSTGDNGSDYSISANGLGCREKSTVTVNNAGELRFIFQPNVNPTLNIYILGLMEFKITKINFVITQVSKLETIPETFINTSITKGYWKFDNYRYTVIDDYQDSRLRGTSITLNDLVYDPNGDHKLFIRKNPCVYNSYLRGKLFYRSLDSDKDRETWRGETDKIQNLNSLYLYTGPCFITDNLT